MRRPLIGFLTDFGIRDWYVASMKAIILSRCPGATLVDITHDIPPQDIREGAYVLRQAYRWFPPGTVHLAVVDPGVGGVRRPIALQADLHQFVGPDNGLLSRAISRARAVEAVLLHDRRYALPRISRTFHGRDLFAPAAAHLARGLPLSALGPAVVDLVQLPDLLPGVSGSLLSGTVVHLDRFGNAITNILEQDLQSFLGGAPFEIAVRSLRLTAISDSYDSVPPGAPVAVFGSGDELEISVSGGNAGRDLGIQRGDEVRIAKKPGRTVP